MKKLLLIVILTINFQSFTKADDVSDFQIGGMSLGDSLLDYLSEQDIQKYSTVYYPDKEFIFANINSLDEVYEEMQIGYKNGDKNYKIELINGVINFNQAIQKCYEKQNEILEYIKKNFTDLSLRGPLNYTRKNQYDQSFEARMYDVDLNSKAQIVIYCSDHKIENNRDDELKVQIESKIMTQYLRSQQ